MALGADGLFPEVDEVSVVGEEDAVVVYVGAAQLAGGYEVVEAGADAGDEEGGCEKGGFLGQAVDGRDEVLLFVLGEVAPILVWCELRDGYGGRWFERKAWEGGNLPLFTSEDFWMCRPSFGP